MIVEASEFSIKSGSSEVMFTGATHRLPPTFIEIGNKDGSDTDRIVVDLGVLARSSSFSLQVIGSVGSIEILGPPPGWTPRRGDGAFVLGVRGAVDALTVVDRSFGLGKRRIYIRGDINRSVRVEIDGVRSGRELEVTIDYPREDAVQVSPSEGVKTSVTVSDTELLVRIDMADLNPPIERTPSRH